MLMGRRSPVPSRPAPLDMRESNPRPDALRSAEVFFRQRRKLQFTICNRSRYVWSQELEISFTPF